MKKSRGIVFFMSFVCTGILGSFTFASAAEATKTSMPPRIGIVDLDDLLRAHPKMNADLKVLQAEAQKESAEIMQQAQAIQDEAKVLQSMKQGSTEFMAKNDEIMKRAQELELVKAKSLRALNLKQLRIVYEAYNSIKDEINAVAYRAGYVVILNNKTIDPKSEDPSVAEFAIGQSVVWSTEDVDLTNYFITALNKKYQNYTAVCTINENKERVFSTTNSAAGITTPRATAVDNNGATGATGVAGQRQPATAAGVRPQTPTRQ